MTLTDLPKSTTYAIVGAGVHGLSTALHLARELAATGRGSGADVVVLDKTAPGAGATGIACGCVRNFYMTEPLHDILRHSLDVWMEDPVNYAFQQVGYISCGEGNQIDDYGRIHRHQNDVGYPSDLYVGAEGKAFLKAIWPDFVTDGIDVVLHEKKSGYAGTRQFVRGLVEKCEAAGVRILSGVEVLDYESENGTVRSILTDRGRMKVDMVILSVGAWVGKHWSLLGKPATISCGYADGRAVEKDMWTYWRLLEGEVYVDEPYRTAIDGDPPVLHVEMMNTPVVDPATGKEIQDHLYVYWKNGAERMDRPGVQGGTIPIRIGPEAMIDPYGHANDEYQADDWFADYMCAAMGQLMGRFEGCRKNFRERRNGGVGAFTPDNVPVFDWIAPNVYMTADSNHGFKMAGVGKLLARELVRGETPAALKPFAFTRFAEGRTFGASNSHSPWV
ncbi:NAD(P)/FAD-dependent oxidoreductase [Oceanibacterium hippocampi]|uniref:4-methylaminobutanoate oxidase (Formaldehyde-forming) n=1 Tax=Oceanibacterium hippocampi TaxID=745714 RepID=A0A1Y5R9J6_9PROT|nr:FAD-binding oxidoreductase [Oceanibacterium hippocampi]SLN11572.1 4-methylaminobutanoate oxidase (formaldehyde-forming) [Oceanibacterium hippocampi]